MTGVAEPTRQGRAAGRPLPEWPRIVFVTDIVTPYATAVFEALSRLAPLKVVFCSGTGSRGADWGSAGRLPFKHEVIDGLTIGRGSPDETDYYLSPRIAMAIARARPDAVISGGWSVPTLYATAIARARGIPLLIQSDGTSHSERRMNLLQRVARRVLVPIADGSVANSELSARRFEELGFPPERVFRAPHATRIEPFLELGRSRGPRGREEPLRLIPRKGVDRLLMAVERARAAAEDVRLTVVGSGPEEERLRSLARRLGIAGAVEWRGFSQQQELPRAYGDADAFAFPTFSDPFGIVAIEAAAAGLPLLASPFGGATADLVTEGETGFVLDPADVSAWAQAMLRLARDPELGLRMGSAAHRRAATRTPENAACGYLEAVKVSLRRRAGGA